MRMIEAERRRRAELGKIQRMEEKLRREHRQRHIDIWKCQLEEEDELLQQRRDVFARRSSTLSSFSQLEEEEGLNQQRLDLFARRSSSFPPPFIYASASESQDEIDQDSTTYPPREIDLKTDPEQYDHVSPQRHEKKQCPRIRCADICTKEQLRDTYISQAMYAKEKDHKIVPHMDIADDDVSAPPHLIAVEDVSDEEEENECLDSIWGHRIPAKRPSTVRHTC
eukprot:CAMPEP_0172314798 /NCGR_PEP_ID=MMETSP1058-20130122/23341_1 /TAXON_ID=83371 /ORGANISM="Detonula confervacea, Strain CCMP 353" /LENGTH=223 /DNA_ID=CAMNT_0013028745 /DNA_START=520 /DNA_END=1191 /DNA_ORIENTATION=+